MNSVFSAGTGCLEALEDVSGLGSLNQNTRVPAILPDPTGAEGSSWIGIVSHKQSWLSATAEEAQ